MAEILDKLQTWSQFHKRWAGLKPPLRPNHEVVDVLKSALIDHDSHVLLLGVTPEFADLGEHVTALERVPETIQNIWPGDASNRKAVLGNWLSPPFEEKSFSAIIGDGPLVCIPYSSYPLFFEQMRHVLQADGIILLRLYLSPDLGQSIEQVRIQTLSGQISSFHAFKWQLAMAMSYEAGRPDVAVCAIHQVFEREFSDRNVLSKATGWSLETIAEIDAYYKADYVFSFPTLSQIVSLIPDWNAELIPAGTYPLAERCPILRIVSS